MIGRNGTLWKKKKSLGIFISKHFARDQMAPLIVEIIDM